MSELGLRKRIALEAAAQISRNIRKEHPLRQLFWECTLRCNVSCRHCGSDCRKLSEVRDMPREDFLRVLDSIARKTDPHQVFVTITGGEPLLREDLEQCGRAIFERGFPWGLVTNGLALTPERFEALHKAGMHSITVSMDGLEDNHNWMRRHPQSFQKVDQVLDLFVQYPQINTDVVTCVNQRNYQERRPCCQRPHDANQQRTVSGDARLHPSDTSGGTYQCLVWLRGFPGSLRR